MVQVEAGDYLPTLLPGPALLFSCASKSPPGPVRPSKTDLEWPSVQSSGSDESGSEPEANNPANAISHAVSLLYILGLDENIIPQSSPV